MELGEHAADFFAGEHGWEPLRFAGADDTLPKRVLEEASFPGQSKGVPLDEMLPTYYKLRGWDKNGVITDRTLDRLKIRR